MVGHWCIIEAFVRMLYYVTGRSLDCRQEATGGGCDGGGGGAEGRCGVGWA